METFTLYYTQIRRCLLSELDVVSVFWKLLKPVTPAHRPRAALRDLLAVVAASHLGHISYLVPARLCRRRTLEGLPREAVCTLFLEVFKETPDMVLSGMA